MMTMINLQVQSTSGKVAFMVNAVKHGQKYRVNPSEIAGLVDAVRGVDYSLSDPDGGQLVPMTPRKSVWALCPLG